MTAGCLKSASMNANAPPPLLIGCAAGFSGDRTDAAGPVVDAQVVSQLALSCRDQLRVRFDYEGRNREPGAREVEPYRLVNDRRLQAPGWQKEREWNATRHRNSSTTCCA